MIDWCQKCGEVSYYSHHKHKVEIGPTWQRSWWLCTACYDAFILGIRVWMDEIDEPDEEHNSPKEG